MFNGFDIQVYLGESDGVSHFIRFNQDKIDLFSREIVASAVLLGVSLDGLKKYLSKQFDDQVAFFKQYDQRQTLQSLQKRLASCEPVSDEDSLF